eukprot:7777102-Ditylum_brightwellii.AAC.1
MAAFGLCSDMRISQRTYANRNLHSIRMAKSIFRYEYFNTAAPSQAESETPTYLTIAAINKFAQTYLHVHKRSIIDNM